MRLGFLRAQPTRAVLVSQRLGFLTLAHLAQQGGQALGRSTRLHILHAVEQHIGQEVDRVQRARVAVTRRLPQPLQHLLEQRHRLLQPAHFQQQPAHADEQYIPPPLNRRQPPQRRPPLIDQGLAQQADDQCVALVKAHALLQLVQNVGLVLRIAAVRLSIGEERLRYPKGVAVAECGVKGYSGAGVLTHTEQPECNQAGAALLAHLPHVHPRQPLLDRVEVVADSQSVHQRPLKGLLLRRAHDHVERCAADLGVVDLLDAVGALERLRVVPRLQQQHRVPNGTDAVAEVRQVGAHVGLPDHVVAHPEERVLVPQPLLLEEVAERV
eukprot:scaffold64387_cov64-Phaeocystis_antarctica.AAC.5